MEPNSSSARWTCDACGCRTNEQSDQSCSICGTARNTGPLYRRGVGGGFSAAARAGWFARGFRRDLDQDDDDDEDDLWESVVDDINDESAIESLAMEVSGMARGRMADRQRFLEAARAFSQASSANNEVVQRVNPTELLQSATLQAREYQPVWVNPSTLLTTSGRNQVQSSIEWSAERRNVAHLPPYSGHEGRAIRSELPLPRGEGLSQLGLPSPGSNLMPGSRQRAFGFRVAFDHPTCEVGGNMGGGYLVGVTTTSFTSYGESNGLQQTPFFWGIEDAGRRYEGSRRGPPSRSSRRTSSSVPSPFASDIRPDEAPLNTYNVLFGSREVISVVCDIESRTLTYWRDQTLLGTLVTNLPRGSNLYPVVVPVHRGVAVAITGLDGDPLSLLVSFSADWQRAQREKEELIRQRLASERDMLMRDGKLTPRLTSVLTTIFALYAQHREVCAGGGRLEYCEAARLWYRCGMKIGSLDKIMASKPVEPGSNQVSLGDFLGIVDKVVEEDEMNRITSSRGLSDPSFQVGDKVQLVKGFEQFGDASGGPLQPGDRGVVVDLQSGPNGERRSVRVLHNGRRWWYQPQAILSERSGLIEAPAVWFLRKLLRAHGYDHATLKPLNETPVTTNSVIVGDIVKPKPDRRTSASSISPFCVGRITTDSACSSGSHSTRSRESGTMVPVDFVDPTFADATGVKSTSTTTSKAVLESRRVRATKLVFCSAADIVGLNKDYQSEDAAVPEPSEGCPSSKGGVSDRLRTEISALARFDRSAIEQMARECRKSPESLATLFSAGLPEAVISAIDVAQKQMNSLEPREDLPEKIGLIGKLATIVAAQLFGQSKKCAGMEASSDTAHQPVERASERRENDLAPGSQNLAVLQHRRNMLLSLVSRARRGNARYLNELMERENEVFGGDASGLPPSLRHLNAALDDPFSMSIGFGRERQEDGSTNGSTVPRAQPQPEPRNFLDSILRCRGEDLEISGTGRGAAGSTHAIFVRNLANTGVLTNNLAWTTAYTDSQAKKIQLTSIQKSTSMLRDSIDEEGTPLLLLAATVGCSPDVLGHLISKGTPVGRPEILRAASTDQPAALSLLLQHSSYPDDLDVSPFSDEVKTVFARAKARQEDLDRRMRDEAGTFVVHLLRRMLRFCRAALSRRSPRAELCSRTIADVLIGSVILNALQTAQSGNSSTNESAEAGLDLDPVNRCAMDEDLMGSFESGGLLGLLPRDTLDEAVLSDTEFLTLYLGLVEDFLFTRDLGASASGLAMLLCLLRKFPEMASCTEVERYGLSELVAFHDALSTNRINEISEKIQKLEGARALSLSNPTGGGSLVVTCPNKHKAVIHVTRHSSFRCDICGNGVERGRPMHGCRECDWDACEECTDRSESGILKCSTIKKMASECMDLLSEPGTEGTASRLYLARIENFARQESISKLDMLCARLLGRHDTHALKDLGTMLLQPGKVTVHQFLNTVLPALYAALATRGHENDGALAASSSRRSKKARTVDDPESIVDPPDRAFCKKAIRLLFSDEVVRDGSSEDDAMMSAPHVEQNEAETEPRAERSSNSSTKYSDASQELLRRLQQILSVHERIGIVSSESKSVATSTSEGKGGDLQVLTKPFKIMLCPSSFGQASIASKSEKPLVVDVEPLVPIEDLERHVLRCRRVTNPSYADFSNRLANDRAVIIERGCDSEKWNIAVVTAFDDTTGAHLVRFGRPKQAIGTNLLHLKPGENSVFDLFSFDATEETMVVLAAREFFVVGRCIEDCEVIDTNIASPMQCEMSNDAPGESSESLREAVGSRVESNCRSSSVWEVFTLINFDPDSGCILVSDQGVVYTGVQHEQIRVPKKSPANQPSSRDADARLPSWARDERASLSRAFPFLASRQRNDHQSSSDKPSNPESRVLKRNWSAISLVDAMRPVDLDLSDSQGSSVQPVDCMVFALESEGKKVNLVCDNSMAERPPCLRVKLSMNENLPGTCFNSSKDTTLVGALRLLHKQGDTGLKWPPADKVTTKLFFSIDVDNVFTEEKKQLADVSLLDPSRTSNRQLHADVAERSSAVAACFANRARKLSSRSLGSDDEECQNELCEGLDDVSIQCMEVISLLAEYARDTVLHAERDEAGESLFANNDLSKKLSSQLDDPLAVVGGMLPEWCIKAPSFAPRVFDYESRRRLLERVAFGVSRGTLKQQETKVNVGRLRQRMASLRARAVELVGEAFSGGAEDPTALQLQADELYGMEEALAARVRASFRAVRWQEHVLQVAKAQIRREHLLMDADAAMEQYASDKSVFRRRLEVRFKGESGFDAASGNEAGVTRGFYADVAEALLCCENVAGVYCSSSCSVPPGVASLKLSHAMEIDGLQEMSKLPLWIPDMDASGQVVIPTPRADPRSGLGVYPRPLPHYHPQMPEVLRRFRFIGRLFASALRDGFMFPLPLSSAFLKLVQKGKEASPSLDAKGPTFELVLTSEDLPRAGFLGGEVYAAEMYVCKVLDGIDSADPPLSSTELERMYKEIASDRSFARLALGKSYDCSFEEYFQDRTFVDPLDPSQGEEAVPLCPNGHRKQVTIYNIREWVALAKNFILHDGVMNQALAFRQGVEDFFSASYFRLFTPEELQRDVCGVGDSVDSWDEAAVRKLFKLDGGKGTAEALVAVAAIGGEGGAALSRRFGPSSPTISHLVRALLEATPNQRRQFLSFVTSVPIVTPGHIEVVPVVSPSGEFLPMQDPSCLPRANTCARRLYLPKFETYESFCQVLWAVVREESKFKGFFEWRGS